MKKYAERSEGKKKYIKIKRGPKKLNFGASKPGVRGGPGPLGPPGSASAPATKLQQGNVFTSVCQEFCPGGACKAGGVHGEGAWQRGVCGKGTCMAGGHAWQEKWPLQWAVCILLECILVVLYCCSKNVFGIFV